MKVLIPSALRSYTESAATSMRAGATLAELLADLDRRYPGLRFRMIDEQDKMRPPYPLLRQWRADLRPGAPAAAGGFRADRAGAERRLIRPICRKRRGKRLPSQPSRAANLMIASYLRRLNSWRPPDRNSGGIPLLARHRNKRG